MILGIKGTLAVPNFDPLISSYSPTEAKTMRVLLYGDSGSGKTTLAATSPDPLFIDTDSGLASIPKKVDVIDLSAVSNPFMTVVGILQAAKTRTGPFDKGGKFSHIKTIVIDSYTSLVDDFFLPELMTEGSLSVISDKASFTEYGRLKGRCSLLSSLLKEVSKTYNVVVTALVDEEKDEITGAIEGKPLMTGKYRDKIMADFDEVYFLRSQTDAASTGPQTRFFLHAQPYRWFQAKTRLTKLTVLENPTYEKIIAARKIQKDEASSLT